MYLSRIKLDMTKRRTMLAMKDPALIHGAVESSFTGERKRRLWRMDSLAGERYLLVLSPEKGDFTQLDEQFGKGEGWLERDYTPLLERTAAGSVWLFRLRTNPVKSVPVKGERGIVRGHITPVYQKQWLKDRSEKYGFALEEEAFDVTGIENIDFHKGTDGNRVTMLAVTYEGKLTVIDQAVFNETLIGGIGRGKAYGLGLMTIVRENGV